MAIKIDLLPGYVGLRRWFKRTLIVSVLLLAAVGSFLYLKYAQGELDLKTAKADAAMMATAANQTKNVQDQTTAFQAETAKIQPLVSYFVDASKTGPERAALLDLVRRYIYPNSVISSIDISDGKIVTFTATVETPDDYVRFLTQLRKGTAGDPYMGPLFATLPRAQGVGGFPQPMRPTIGSTAAQGQQPGQESGAGTGQLDMSQPHPIIFPIKVTAQAELKNPLVAPVEPQ